MKLERLRGSGDRTVGHSRQNHDSERNWTAKERRCFSQNFAVCKEMVFVVFCAVPSDGAMHTIQLQRIKTGYTERASYQGESKVHEKAKQPPAAGC